MRFKSRSRALAASALAASLGLAGLTLAASPAQATEETEVIRVAGTTRYGTAAEAATQAYPTGSTNVVLASGEKFPDALAGGGLAGSLDAPILLTQEDTVPADTTAALEELGAENVTILGGTAAVSASVETALEALGYTVDRVAGADRFETAGLIADELGGTTAVLANGLRFPDALAISPGAHALGLPVLLTTADTLNADAAAYIDGNAVDEVIIVGGTAVVSQDIEDALEADGITVTRLAGATRYESAVAIAEFHVTQGFTLDALALATGENFADALAGGPFASQMGAPMVLTQTDTLTPSTAAFISDNAAEVDTLYVLGGTAAITDATAQAAADAGQASMATGVTVAPELVSASIISTVTPAQASPSNPAGTVVEFVFDENVSIVAPIPGNFFVYGNNGDAAVNVGDAGNTLVSASDNAVRIRFTDIDSAAEASGLVAGTVGDAAVRDSDNVPNPPGSAVLNDGVGSQPLPAGITAGPDLASVGNFREAAAADSTAIDFTFDQAANTTATPDFRLIALDGSTILCTEPAAADLTPGGGTSPGGNTTATITVVCPDFDAVTPLTTTNIARGVVLADSVVGTDTTAQNNELQAADVGNSGNTVNPDLVSAQFSAAGFVGDTDDVLLTFDEAVLTANNALISVYTTGGTATAASTASVVNAPSTQVIATFPAGTLTGAVGVNVGIDAVTAADTPGVGNEEDEVGVANTTAAVGPGKQVGRPNLVSVELEQPTDDFDNVLPWVATYTFDQAVDDLAAGQFRLMLANGVDLDCQASTDGATTATENQVTCSEFELVGTATDATQAQIGSAVLGIADFGAAEAQGGGLDNYEDSVPTTGGTGTPAS